jgi:hypothetical protein
MNPGKFPGRLSGVLSAGLPTERLASSRDDALRVGRFLRGRIAFRPRPDDVFISSYPRSGTTWLQHTLLVLARDGDPGFDHIDDVVPWFERSLSLGVRTADDFEALPAPRIFKSHLPRAWLPPGRHVYAVRDGRDVAVSYFHLYRSHLGFEGGFDDFFERFLRGRLQYGSWFKHVAGWRAEQHRGDVLIVQYEQMKQDLPAVMRQLDAFCGFGRSPERIDALSEQCTFEYMKAREARFDHATERRAGRGTVSGQFIRSGRTGSFGELFDEAKQRAFDEMSRRRRPLARFELDLPAFLH